MIDDGAVKALQSGKSLLPAGLTKIMGSFERGDAIRILDISGQAIAVGLSNFSAQNAEKIKGRHSSDIAAIIGFAGRDEFIHRDDLALF
jgi:glutamate 5-kinase